MHWWLPNDEDYPPVIRGIRAFVEERTAPARDVATEDLRDIKAIFKNMKLDDDGDFSKGRAQAIGRASDAADQSKFGIGGASEQGSDAYQLGFDEGQGFWGGGQSGGAFGIPKPEDYM